MERTTEQLNGNLSTEEESITRSPTRSTATNHTYEATYETQLDGLAVEEGEDSGNQRPPLHRHQPPAGQRRSTVTKEWQDGDQLEEFVAESEIVPVVKLVFDDEKNNAEPPEGVTIN